MSEQDNHTDRGQRLKTDLELVREEKKRGTVLHQAFLDWLNECNREGLVVNFQAVPVGKYQQTSSITIWIDPEERKYD